MDIDKEHWQTNKHGDFEGLFTVSLVEGAHEDIWDKLDILVGAYTKVHPKEVEECVRENIFIAQQNFTSMGEGKNTNLGLRHRARIPAGLMKAIEVYAPEVFEDKNMYQAFLQHFPGFRVFEKV